MKPPISVPTESRQTAESWLKSEHYPNVRIEYPTTHGLDESATLAEICEAFAASSSLLPVGRQPFKLSVEAVEELVEEIKRLKNRLQWLESNLCAKHLEIQTCSSGPCPMCERDKLAGLPTARQPQMDDVMRYLESENFGDIATDHKDGGEFCISDAILSFVRFWETQASLPVGESRQETFDWKMAYRRLALFLHRRDRHNQFIERCEYSRCNPDGAPHITLAEVEQLRNEGEYCPSALPAEKETELGLGESREPLPCHVCGTILDPNWLNCPKCEGPSHTSKMDALPSVPAEIESTEPKEPS